MRLRRVQRAWWLLKSHRPSQFYWRGVSLVRRRLFPLFPHSQVLNVDGAQVTRRRNEGFDAIVDRQLRLRKHCWKDEVRSSDVLAGEFEFLGERRRLSLPMDWAVMSVAPVSRLWRFYLQYHEFLLELVLRSRETEDAAVLEHSWAVVEDWIDSNPVAGRGALDESWHPFCLSKRIAVWLILWHAAEPPQSFRAKFAASLESQIRFLERHLEWDLRGNHLLENLRTLAMAGAFLEGPTADRRLARAERLFRQQLAEQILESGEHFERSPMYHAQMLSAVLDVRDSVKELRPTFAATCAEYANRMAKFLRTVTHPDGKVGLLSDSAFEETPDVETLCADAEGEPGRASGVVERSRVHVVGKYWKWQEGEDCLLFDAGAVGADELPAHAHCDLLGFEASLGGRRAIVDSGVHDYEDREMRRYCRSTAAHNVLQIDGVEQCDVWSRFRMGYRGRPCGFEHGQSGDVSWCRATHDAYRRIGVPVVGRWLACREGGPWFCLDWAEGVGEHELVSRLHVHPDVSVELEAENVVRLKVGERVFRMAALTDAGFAIERGWYCPSFGIRLEAPVVRCELVSTLPAYMGWMLHEASRTNRASLISGRDGIALRWQNGKASAVLHPTGSHRFPEEVRL